MTDRDRAKTFVLTWAGDEVDQMHAREIQSALIAQFDAVRLDERAIVAAWLRRNAAHWRIADAPIVGSALDEMADQVERGDIGGGS